MGVNNRRWFLKSAVAAGLAANLFTGTSARASRQITSKPIPGTGERIPVIGMGTWQTFNVGNSTGLRNQRCQVLKQFFDMGGGMVDSSPMYGSSEAVIGHCLDQLGSRESLFSATKIWTPLKNMGVSQVRDSQDLWGISTFDLFQIHNLVGWEGHLETLLEMKDNNQIRYVGITTSHGRRHGELEKVLSSQPFDFVQLTYNIRDRQVEKRLLPLAGEKGIAVIANRPFQRGALIDWCNRHPLPDWAGEIDCSNWAQFLLKFIVSHPTVTCAIPATTQVAHMTENMGAQTGLLPDGELRKRMIEYVRSL